MKRRRRTTASSVDWSSLPGDLVEQISDRLSTDADHLHIHQVCTHWRACTSPPPTTGALRPWILAHRMPSSLRVTPDCYSIWLPRRRRLQRKVDTAAPPPDLPYCVGASRGWLALVDHTWRTRLVLWDPVSGAQVPLPAPRTYIIEVFLSADPLVSPDWVAVAIQPGKAFFCRPGDAAWSVLCGDTGRGIKSIALHGGRIYYTDFSGNLVVCDLTIGPGSPPRVLHTINISRPMDRLCKCDYFHPVHRDYLLTFAGELLLVVLRHSQASGDSHPSFAEVYKLLKPEWTPESGQPLQIIGDRVTDLGEHSLVLGRRESFALSAKEFPTIKRNHVYGLSVDAKYNGVNRFYERSFVFDLASDTLKIIPYPKEFHMDNDDESGDWRPFFWFCHRSSPFVKKHQHLSEN